MYCLSKNGDFGISSNRLFSLHFSPNNFGADLVVVLEVAFFL
jgi:hypothetical protein